MATHVVSLSPRPSPLPAMAAAFAVCPFLNHFPSMQSAASVSPSPPRTLRWLLHWSSRLYDTAESHGIQGDSPSSCFAHIIRTKYGLPSMAEQTARDLFRSTTHWRTSHPDAEMVARFLYDLSSIPHLAFFVHMRKCILQHTSTRQHRSLCEKYKVSPTDKPDEDLHSVWILAEEWNSIIRAFFRPLESVLRGCSSIREKILFTLHRFAGRERRRVVQQKQKSGTLTPHRSPLGGLWVFRVRALALIDFVLQNIDLEKIENEEAGISVVDLCFPHARGRAEGTVQMLKTERLKESFGKIGKDVDDEVEDAATVSQLWKGDDDEVEEEYIEKTTQDVSDVKEDTDTSVLSMSSPKFGSSAFLNFMSSVPPEVRMRLAQIERKLVERTEEKQETHLKKQKHDEDRRKKEEEELALFGARVSVLEERLTAQTRARISVESECSQLRNEMSRIAGRFKFVAGEAGLEVEPTESDGEFLLSVADRIREMMLKMRNERSEMSSKEHELLTERDDIMEKLNELMEEKKQRLPLVSVDVQTGEEEEKEKEYSSEIGSFDVRCQTDESAADIAHVRTKWREAELEMQRMENERIKDRESCSILAAEATSQFGKFVELIKDRLSKSESRVTSVQTDVKQRVLPEWQRCLQHFESERKRCQQAAKQLRESLQREREVYGRRAKEHQAGLRKIRDTAKQEIAKVTGKWKESEKQNEDLVKLLEEKDKEMNLLKPGGSLFQEKMEVELRRWKLRNSHVSDIISLLGAGFDEVHENLFYTLQVVGDTSSKNIVKSDVVKDSIAPQWQPLGRMDDRLRSSTQFVVRVYSHPKGSTKKESMILEHLVDISSLRPYDPEKQEVVPKNMLMYVIGNQTYWSPSITSAAPSTE